MLTSTDDPTARAEGVTVRNATKRRQTYDLAGSDL